MKYHTVKKSDTLSSISKSYKTTVTAIKKLNPGVKDPNTIKVGQKIRVK